MIKRILLGGAFILGASGFRMKDMDEELLKERIVYIGTVKEDVEKGSQRIVVKKLESDHPKADSGLFCEELILLTEGVTVVDENDVEKSIDGLKKGDKLKVVTPVVVPMTNSIPPQIPGRSLYEVIILD